MSEISAKQLAQLAAAAFVPEGCPPALDLAAYILGELRGTDELRVAAHVRQCSFCRHDIAASRPPPLRPPLRIARLLPLAFAGGRRGATEGGQHYRAADIAIDLTIAPSLSDDWRLTGQISRAGAGLPDRPVIARHGRLRYHSQSDELGFFTFSGLPDGRYTLTVDDPALRVQIRGLELLGEA